MLKSILKNQFLLLLFLFISVVSNAQVSIYGDWSINDLIGINDVEEYSMQNQNEVSWGNNVKLALDGTFSSGYRAECGNDCFKSTFGKFIVIDDFHIRFILNDIHFSGWCNEKLKSQSGLNRDLGIFYMYKDSKSIRLIKSNGVLQDDKDKMLYTEMLSAFDKNWKSYDYSWGNTKENTPDEIVKDCVDKRKLIDLATCKVVYSKKENYGQLFLVKEKEKFHYVLYSDFNQKVSLAYPR